MVSKNNKMELFQKQANKAKRYTLKKLSIGVTSVATGTVLFLGHANSVSANESMNEEQVTVAIIDENIVRTEDLSNEVASEGEESVDSSDLNDPIESNHPIEEEHIPNQNLNQFVLVARERANRYIPNLPNLTEDQKVHYTNRVNTASSVAEIEKIYEEAMSVLPIAEEQPSEAVVPPNRYVVVVRDRALNIISALENLYDAQKEDYKKQIQGASSVSKIEAIISEAEGVINTSVGDEEAPQISKGKLEEPESNHSPIEQEPKEKYPGNAQTPEKLEHKVQYGKQEERIQQITDYSIEYTEDPELYVGQERLKTPGIQGVTEIIRVYETADGRVTGRVLSEEVNVISASQKQVVARGTKPISGIEEVVEEVTIDPETSKVYDSTLYLGESAFVPGESGRKKVTTVYKTLYGKRTEEVLKTTEEVLIPATNHVLRQGTKPVEGEETVVEEVTVVAPTVEEETDDFYVGEGEKVEGSDGLKRVTRVYRTVKGKKTDKLIRESEEIITEAKPHILRKGTKPVDGSQAVVTEEVIQPETIEQKDSNLYEGEERVVDGSVGRKQIRTVYKTNKGNVTDEVLNRSEATLEEARPTIVYKGTKPVEGSQVVVTEEVIQPETIEETDDGLYVGEQRVEVGSVGRKKVTTTYKTYKGELTKNVVNVSEVTIEDSTPKIVYKGTKPVDGSQAVVTEEVIQPETIEQKDSNLYEGEEHVVDGSVGRKKVTTTYKTYKGELTEEVLGVNEETIEDARPTIIYKGTKSLEGTKNIISEEVIQPETILEEDNGLYEGEERVVKGTPGLKQITKTYKTYKGELTEEVLAIKEEIIEKSSPKIVYKGTKAVVGSEEVVTEEVIQPKTIEQEDSNLYVGEQDITDGIVGRKRITKTYKTIKGERTNDVLDTKEETLVKSQPKIVRNGTKAVEGTEDVVTYETIQPDTREETDNNLYVGEERTVDGSVGRRQITTTYRTHKGQRTEQVVNVSTEMLEDARPTIIYRGTKPVEGTEEVVSYEVIEPGTSEETDDGLYKDEQRVVQGSPGRLEVTTTYRTRKGKRTEEVVNRSERTVEAAQPTITYVGTKPVEGTEEVVTYETIEPETETVQTAELYEGDEEVTEGKAGRKEITTTYKTHKGQRTDDVVNVSTKTLEEATPKIVRQGTKPVNGREEVVREERIEPKVIEQEDNTLPEGETVTEQGQPGTRRITTVYKTVRSERTEEVIEESSDVTQEAIPTIVRKGVRFEAPSLSNAHFTSDAMNRTARLSYTLNNPSNLDVSGYVRVSRDGEMVRDVQISNFNDISIDNLDVNTPYQFEARLTYTRGGQEQDISAHTDTHTLSMNQLELKSLGKTTLVRREADGRLREFSELHEKPSDLSTYYIRAQASHMKDIVMPVASIEEVQKDGDTVYAVKTASDETVHRDGDVFKPGSVFYVNKYKAPENGVYYNFADLVQAMSNNPRGTFTLGRTVSATGIQPLGRKTYIQADFRGTLSGLHNGKRHRIEGLEHGLFTKVNGGQIRDIDFTGVNIVYPDSWEGDYISSLAGDLTNGGVIENVNVQGYIEGRDHVSGLVNTMSNQSRIENVSFIGRIKSHGGNSISGAIAGTNNHSIVTRAYVDADMEMHRPKDASLLVAITTSDQGRAGRWGKTTKSVVKGSMRSNLRGKMAAISTSAWGYATVSDVVSYATIQNGHELFGSDEQLKDSGPAYRNIGPVYGVQNVSDGSVKGSDEKFERLSPTDAARKVREFDLSAIDQLSSATPAETLNGSRRYDGVSGYVAAHEAFYRFVEVLQPFSLVEDIVREGNALAQSDKRPTWMAEGKELKSITALKGNEFVTSGDDADQIMLQFTDGTKLMYGLTNKKAVDLFKDKHTSGNGYHLSQYQVEGLGVTYTMNRLSNVSRELVESLTSELGSVGLYNSEMYQMLKINEKNEKAKENRMKKLFLDEIFEETKANLSSILDKLIQNEMVMLSSSDVAVNALKDKITTHKKQIMMALTYLNRYYNIRFGDYNIKDLMMYLPEFYSGQGGSLIDRLIKLGSSTEYQLHGRRTHEFFNREFGAPMGTKLLDFLDFNRELFTEFDNMNDWFKDATKENVKLIERAPLAEGLKAQNPKYRVFDNLSHGYYHHTILPLLNLRKAKMFMISTIASLTFGSEQKRAYLNEAQLQKEIETAGDRHRDFIDSWYKIANDETKDRLMRDRVTPIWEGFHLHERGWVNEFGKDNRGQDYAPSREFYNVIGEYYGSNGTGAYANGTLIHFVVYDYLGEGGHATWSHEMTHNYDGLVFLGGPGRRNGVGAEAYASGMLQSPGQNGGGYGGLGVNLSYSWEDDGNNIYNSDPKKFHNQEMWDKYMKGYNDALTLLDYLEGEAAIKAGRDVQRHWFKKMGKTDIRATRFTDHVRPLTDEEWRNLNLQSVNDLVDNQLMTKHGLNNGTYSQDNDWGTYITVDYLTGIYGGGDNSKGVPGAAMFKHNTFRVWGRYGYENGFVGYASNKHREQALRDGHAQLSDDYAINKISGGKHQTMEDFKKDYFNDMITQLKTKGMIDIQIDGVQYSSYDSLANKFSQTVQADTKARRHDHTRTFKGKLFKALLHNTDNFLSSIFKG
ncbi:ZmpA/ZmpB/ZmpC family metallo-endopeptidase [Dolosigranulum savutiense]|uniref:ZmpA/ZmpB/ZmpC family metallo-endopeptidase n=1 Tax=Dolosigranulum savutiense TaxID=3110288 RepID=A0AB74U231_9LACT